MGWPGRSSDLDAGMRFPLDLIWLDSNSQVLAVLTDVPACIDAPCPLYNPAGAMAAAVLEAPSGDAGRYGIVAGVHLSRSPLGGPPRGGPSSRRTPRNLGF